MCRDRQGKLDTAAGPKSRSASFQSVQPLYLNKTVGIYAYPAALSKRTPDQPATFFPNGAEARDRTNNTRHLSVPCALQLFRSCLTCSKRDTSYSRCWFGPAGWRRFLVLDVGPTTYIMCRSVLAFLVSEVVVVVVTSVQLCVHGEPLALCLAAKKAPQTIYQVIDKTAELVCGKRYGFGVCGRYICNRFASLPTAAGPAPVPASDRNADSKPEHTHHRQADRRIAIQAQQCRHA